MAKLLLKREAHFHWAVDNKQKTGREIYGIKLAVFESIPKLPKPQIIEVVSSPDGKMEIEGLLDTWQKKTGGRLLVLQLMHEKMGSNGRHYPPSKCLFFLTSRWS